MTHKLSILALVFTALFVVGADQAQAEIIHARETLRDRSYTDGSARELFRQRENSVGFNERLYGDEAEAAMITDNQLDSDFGLDNANTVSFRHDLSWLDPEAEEFLEVRIVIIAYGPDGAYEWIRFDGIDATAFQVKEGTYETHMRKAIFLDDSVEINVLLADGYLDIEIEKSADTAIVTSLIDVTYVSASAPEPATLALLGLGGAAAGVAAYRRRRRR